MVPPTMPHLNGQVSVFFFYTNVNSKETPHSKIILLKTQVAVEKVDMVVSLYQWCNTEAGFELFPKPWKEPIYHLSGLSGFLTGIHVDEPREKGCDEVGGCLLWCHRWGVSQLFWESMTIQCLTPCCLAVLKNRGTTPGTTDTDFPHSWTIKMFPLFTSSLSWSLQRDGDSEGLGDRGAVSASFLISGVSLDLSRCHCLTLLDSKWDWRPRISCCAMIHISLKEQKSASLFQNRWCGYRTWQLQTAVDDQSYSRVDLL